MSPWIDYVLIEDMKLAEEFLIMAIQGKVNLFINNVHTGWPFLLRSQQLEIIRMNKMDRTQIKLESPVYNNSTGNYSSLGLFQNASIQDLWMHKNDYEKLMIDPTTTADDADIKLEQSESWRALKKLATEVIKKYPIWKRSRTRTDKIKKTAELSEWIKNEFDAGTREVQFLTRVLSDFFDELK